MKSILAKKDKFGNIKNISKRIKISEMYDYIMSDKKYKNDNTRKYMLSRIKKFIRMLNIEPKLNYKEKIKIAHKESNNENYLEKDVKEVINYLRGKKSPQSLLIFYFLYFGGFTYSNIARITLRDFKKGFSKLILRKRKLIKREIPKIIVSILVDFFRNKNNKSKYFFYDSFEKNTIFSRARLIKNNMNILLKEINSLSQEKINYFLNLFSKARKSKKLTSKYLYLFDIDLNLEKLLKNNTYNLEDNFHSKFNFEPLKVDNHFFKEKSISTNEKIVD